MFNNVFHTNASIAKSVSEVMEKNDIKRLVTESYFNEIGVKGISAIPFAERQSHLEEIEKRFNELSESAFGDAFKAARNKGDSEFEFGGKKYHTRQAGESDTAWRRNMERNKGVQTNTPRPRPDTSKPTSTPASTSKETSTPSASDKARGKTPTPAPKTPQNTSTASKDFISNRRGDISGSRQTLSAWNNTANASQPTRKNRPSRPQTGDKPTAGAGSLPSQQRTDAKNVLRRELSASDRARGQTPTRVERDRTVRNISRAVNNEPNKVKTTTVKPSDAPKGNIPGSTAAPVSGDFKRTTTTSPADAARRNFATAKLRTALTNNSGSSSNAGTAPATAKTTTSSGSAQYQTKKSPSGS